MAPAANSSGAESTALAAASPAAAKPQVGARMHEALVLATQARDALIAGDLAAAQRAGDALAQRDFSQVVPAHWKHWVGLTQQYAQELGMAPNLASAALTLGQLAVVCGDCHEQHERGPAKARVPPEPWRDPPEQFDERMQRHQLGADQLWQGLIRPSEDAFRSGTITLTRAPLAPPLREGEPVDPALHARIEEVRALARQARSARSYEERGRVYGELIARCATCHTFTRPAP